MLSKEPSGDEVIASLLKYISAMADYLEVGARVELASGTSPTDYMRLLSSPDVLKAFEKQYGPEALTRLAVVLLRFVSLPANVFALPPKERIRIASELRNLIMDMKGFIQHMEEKSRELGEKP